MGGTHSCDRQDEQVQQMDTLVKERQRVIESLNQHIITQNQRIDELERGDQFDITLKNSKINLYPNESIISDLGSEIHCQPFIKKSPDSLRSTANINFTDTVVNDNYRTADLNTSGDYTKISDIVTGVLDSSFNITDNYNICPGGSAHVILNMDDLLQSNNNKLPRKIEYSITSTGCDT